MLRASAASIQLKRLYPDSTPDAPVAFLLEIDGVSILLDCGWDHLMSVTYLDILNAVVPTVDAVLISSPELKFCGALPFVVERIKPGAPVVASSSTAKLGLHTALHALLYQFPNTHDFLLASGESFTLTIDKVYSGFRMTREPFGRKVTLKGRNAEVECLTTFAGRILGGYAWTVKYQIDELFYCPDFSLKESHMLKRFVVPTTSNISLVPSFPLSNTAIGSGKRLEEVLQTLFKDIQLTLRNGGDVLIPVNPCGRGIEILSGVVRLLAEKGGDKYKVILASLQAREILDKAQTMTEALLDDVILDDQQLFAKVITCRTAQEALAIPGSKIILAEGETLDYGVAAELLEAMLPINARGADNLVVLTQQPPDGTNAALITEVPHNESMTLRFLKRSKLNKEELEEYYMELERAAEERRRKLEEAGNFIISNADAERSGPAAGGAASDDEDGGDEDDDTAAAPSSPAAAGASRTRTKAASAVASTARQSKAPLPGLFLPSYMSTYRPRFLSFPTLESASTLSGAVRNGLDVSYGLPVPEEELDALQRRAPPKQGTDNDADAQGGTALKQQNDAQREVSEPAKISKVESQLERACKVVVFDLTGHPENQNLKDFLRSKFSSTKKLVALRGSQENWRELMHFCRTEKGLKCGDSVHFPQAGIALELATHVFSYTVGLDGSLSRVLSRNLRRVREANVSSYWEVCWVDGELRSRVEEDDGPDARRHRTEASSLTLAALSAEKAQESAEHMKASGHQRGMYFVGETDLSRLRDVSSRESNLTSEFHKKAPMLVFNEGVCVRRGADGDLTLASIATPSLFEVRKNVYKQFSQTL